MSNRKISELAAITQDNLSPSDIFPVVDIDLPETKKILVSELDERWNPALGTVFTSDTEYSVPSAPYYVKAWASAANISVILPDAAQNVGRRVRVRKVDPVVGGRFVTGHIKVYGETPSEGGEQEFIFDDKIVASAPYLIQADTSSNPIDITLPDPVANAGKHVRVRAAQLTTAGNDITILPNDSETILGQASLVIPAARQGWAICLKSDGTNWVLGGGINAKCDFFMLCTEGEFADFESDGFGWHVVAHHVPEEILKFTPSGSLSTNIVWTGRWFRSRNIMHAQVRGFFNGTNTQGDVILNVPHLQSIAPYMRNGVNNGTTLGHCFFLDDSASPDELIPGHVLATSQDTAVRLFPLIRSASTNTMIQANTNTNIPLTIASGDQIVAKLELPIDGWEGFAFENF